MPQDQRIEKWLEELINDTDADSNEDGTGIPTSEEIALMMAKLDPDIDDGLGIEDVPVAEDIMAMEISISVLGKPPSELLTPLPFPPLTLASSHLQTDPIDRVDSAVTNMSLSSDFDDISPFYKLNMRLSAVLAPSNLPQTADLPADTSFMSDRAFVISPSTSPRPPASPSCYHGSLVLLRLPSLIPTSPSSLSPSSPDHPSFGCLNSIAMSMMRLQSAHTEMATELRFLRDAGGAEVLEQLERNGSTPRQRKGQRKCQRQQNGASGNASSSKKRRRTSATALRQRKCQQQRKCQRQRNGPAPAERPVAAEKPVAAKMPAAAKMEGVWGAWLPQARAADVGRTKCLWELACDRSIACILAANKTPRQQNGFAQRKGAMAPEMPAAAKMAPRQRKC
ncbi:hypothetical protein B0H14DRAFT_3534879 [Mycena olivaceomarginata]|nr:hypothetical protein B0H14DRAFT_3534879 [Mycena olivaceomarginata]